MQLRQLIEALSDPSAYHQPVKEVQVHQTHISVVFLAGDLAYKIKKPVTLGFVDYGTLERRRHYCEEEVRLNRRLAPEVYLGVVPVTQESDSIRMEGEGEVVDWAVKMRRLPDEASSGPGWRAAVWEPSRSRNWPAGSRSFMPRPSPGPKSRRVAHWR